MKIEYVNLRDKVFQLTYMGERILGDYVYETREVSESVPIYGKKYWWSSSKTIIGYEKKSIKKTGWYLKSWRKEDIHWPLSETNEGILDYIARISLSSANYKMGKQFYIDGDMVIHAYPFIKFMLLGNQGTRTLIYVYSFESEEEAMETIDKIKSVNPGLTLIYQGED